MSFARWRLPRHRARERSFRHPPLGNDLAPVKYDRQQRAHAFDRIDRLAGQRSVAVVLGEGDKEIGLILSVHEPEIRREKVDSRDRRSAESNRELALLEIGAVLSLQVG